MRPILTLLLCALPAGAPAPGAPAPSPAAAPVKAITAPSEDLTLSFTRSGRLAKVLVKEGQHVRAGQVLAQLDDSVERKQVALLKAKADDTTGVQLAKLALDRSQAILGKVQKAHDANAAPARELEDALMDVAVGELTLKMRQFEHKLAEGQWQEAKLLLDRMRLASPVAGRVERLLVSAGESVEALAGVVRVVRTDPLWIDAPVGLARARPLKPGCVADVLFADANTSVAGKVIRVAAVADAASATLEVRVEVPNPTARPAGEQVRVTFHPPPPAGGTAPKKPAAP